MADSLVVSSHRRTRRRWLKKALSKAKGVKKAKKKAKSPAKAIEKIPEVKAIKPGVVANIAKKTITDMLVRTEKVKHANRPKVAIPCTATKGGAGKSKGGKKQSKKAKKAGKKAKKKAK